MGIEKQDRHRAGAFKQSNKLHKTGRHRSKGSIESEVKGNVAAKTLSKRVRRELRKEDRRNQSQQIRQRKRDEALAKKRSLGASLAPPLLVVIIPLNEDLDAAATLSLITGSDEDAIVAKSQSGVTHISVPRFKQRFSFLIPPLGNTLANLDAAKVADTILFVVSAAPKSEVDLLSKGIDNWGEEILLASIAQGLPTSIVAITDLESLHPKKRQDAKHQVQKSITKWLPDEKIVPLDKTADALNILRRIGSHKQRIVAYRDKRPHLLAEHVAFTAGNVQGQNCCGTLEVTGYLRGIPLSVNGLVHVPGFGEFQMSQIDAPEDPYPLEKGRPKALPEANDVDMEEGSVRRVLERADPGKQESLQTENIPDPLDAEQTWPTEEELADAEAERKGKRLVKRVPKGTSVYQAAWIPDIDGEEVDQESHSESEEGDEMAVDMDQADSKSENSVVDEENEDYETITLSEAAPDEQRYDQQMDMHEEQQAMKKIKDAQEDARFPDERDTPLDVPAKEYFQKYRGLESFRTSLWDAKENLPTDYARIFQFQNFDRTRKRIIKESADRQGAMPGWYVTIHIAGVSEDLYKAYITAEERPLIVFGLLPHEHKMSVLNVVLKRTNVNNDAIKSKEKLVFQCGFRRFAAAPIFSQHTNGNKHKYERYFQPDSTVVASLYAPVTYSPCPVLCYLEKMDGSMELVATGNVLSANPDRIVIKRVVLSGYPYKVHKRSAVVRFMFFYRDDINWFKPVRLHTKHGRRGHIKEPLGTHGHMKCVFDGQLKSQDTILMNLYKRVFPKWTYDPCLLTETPKVVNNVEME